MDCNDAELTWYRKEARLSALNGSTGLIMREEGVDITSYLRTKMSTVACRRIASYIA